MTKITAANIPALTAEQETAMQSAQDIAAREYWAYPSAEWQMEFQSRWLRQTGLSETGRAITQSGRAVGALDD